MMHAAILKQPFLDIYKIHPGIIAQSVSPRQK